MEAIQQARKLFLKCHHHQTSLTDIDKRQLGRDIQRFIAIAIKEATTKDLFENTCVLVILLSALKQKAYENSDVMPVARAFRSLEKYFLLLVEQPWKPEFREIKMYGGFYRTRVKSALPDCESVFEHAGYMVLPESCTMIYKGSMSKTFLLLLAFDCRVSQVACETIAEHYNKVKGLSMSLADAISNILHDEYTRDKPPVLGYHLDRSNGLIVNMPPISHITAPPALPKREPIVSNLNLRQNGRCDPENGVIHDVTLNSSGKFEAGIAFPPKSPNRTQDLYSSVLTRPPVTPSSVIPESFTYIDAQADEILPELPQGTSEDHMWESLRLVNYKEAPRQHVGDGWKQPNPCNKDNKNATSFNHSNHITPMAYYVNGLNAGGVVAQGQFKTAPSIDEGIELDLPTKSYSHSAKFGSFGGQQVILPNRAHYQQPSYDQGHRSANPESLYNTSLAGGSHNSQHTIYHPPMIVADCPNSGLLNKSLVSSVPPPIPSRSLKPKPVNDEDCLRGKVCMSAPHFTASQPPVMGHFQNELILNRSPVSAPGYSTYSQSIKTEPILRRDRLSLGKTNSLKSGEALSQHAATTRTARSMDMAAVPWECQSCTTINMASNLICFECSHSRLGPDVSQPVIGQTEKPCTSCTYSNSPDMAHCEMCGSKLNDKFTCV